MKGYFKFNRLEKYGVITLMTVILVFIFLLNVNLSPKELPDELFVHKDSLSYIVIKDKKEQNLVEVEKKTSQTKKKISFFDPNDLSKDDWVNLGFSNKQAESILNYKIKIGGFKSKKDVQSSYVVSEYMYEKIEPFIVFKKNKEELFNEESKKEIAGIRIELNAATKEDLITIKWIGPYYADRIIDWRSRTGGFVNINQVDELGLPEEAYNSIIENTTINPEMVKKTNVNMASKNDLKKIPFTNWRVVAEILKSRDQAKIENLDFLTEEMISLEDKKMLSKYLSF